MKLMKLMKIFYGILIGFMILSSCTNDENSNITNGFSVNGKFYATDFAKIGIGNPYNLIFSNPLNESSPEGQFGNFHLISGKLYGI